MKNKELVIAVCFFVILAMLTLSGYFFPGSLNWGFHFLGLLPSAYVVCYIVLFIGIVLYVLFGNIDKRISRVIPIIVKKPAISVALVLSLFIGLAIILRQRLPLLGDSFILINNYENTFAGMHPLVVYREPLAVYFFYFVAHQLGTYVYPAIMNAFLTGEIFLGIGFILNVIVIINCFFPDAKERTLSVIFLLAGSYMQVLLGYAEVYSVVLFLVSLYIAAVAYWMKGKISFYYIPVVFFLQIATHFLTLLLFPSLLVAAYHEYKARGMRNILIGFAIPLAVAVFISVVVSFDFSRFMPREIKSHFLSIVSSADTFQAYTLFSVYHVIDLFNLGVLLGSSSFILLALAGLFRNKSLAVTVTEKFLLTCVVPILCFVVLAKFDLGVATDWDVMTPYFFIAALFALVTFSKIGSSQKMRILTLCTALTLLQSMSWISVNASETSTITRTKLLGDKRIVSQQGFYQLTYHLERYYELQGDTASIIALWKQYVDRYPEEERGYNKVVSYLLLSGNVTSEETLNMLERWLTLDPQNREARTGLANLYINAGNSRFREGNYKDAERYNRRANQLDSLNAIPYNDIGSLYMQRGSVDSAIQCFSRAIQLDSMYISPYENLGLAYIQLEQYSAALHVATKLIKINPEAPEGYEVLAKFYYTMGEGEDAIANLKKAARLGSPDTQKFLNEHGISWQNP